MHDDPVPFNRGAIKPMECLREGWQLIKTQYWLFVGLAFVGALISGAGPMGILAGPMTCGMYHCVFARRNGEEVNFNMLFKGFDYFAQCLVPGLIMTGIMLVSFLVSYAFFVVAMIAIMAAAAPQPGQPPQGAFFGMLMGLYAVFILFILVVSLAVHSAFFFAFPLVMDRGLSGWDAVKLSLQATRANLSGVVGVLLLAQGLALASSLLCCVGQILELPVNVAMMALAYRQVFPQRDALARFDRYDEPDDDSPRQSGAGETGIQSED